MSPLSNAQHRVLSVDGFREHCKKRRLVSLEFFSAWFWDAQPPAIRGTPKVGLLHWIPLYGMGVPWVIFQDISSLPANSSTFCNGQCLKHHRSSLLLLLTIHFRELYHVMGQIHGPHLIHDRKEISPRFVPSLNDLHTQGMEMMTESHVCYSTMAQSCFTLGSRTYSCHWNWVIFLNKFSSYYMMTFLISSVLKRLILTIFLLFSIFFEGINHQFSEIFTLV